MRWKTLMELVAACIGLPQPWVTDTIKRILETMIFVNGPAEGRQKQTKTDIVNYSKLWVWTEERQTVVWQHFEAKTIRDVNRETFSDFTRAWSAGDRQRETHRQTDRDTDIVNYLKSWVSTANRQTVLGSSSRRKRWLRASDRTTTFWENNRSVYTIVWTFWLAQCGFIISQVSEDIRSTDRFTIAKITFSPFKKTDQTDTQNSTTIMSPPALWFRENNNDSLNQGY
jgi:hypothetical protein